MRIGARVQRGHEEWVDEPANPSEPDIAIIAIESTADFDRERIESVTVRWDTGALEVLGRLDETEDQAAHNYGDLIDVTPRLYVNVYLHDRALGGPEEGGWWYDTYSPVDEQCFLAADIESVRAIAEHAQEFCDVENADRNSDIGSVCSDGRYEVSIEAWPAEGSPARRPMYC